MIITDFKHSHISEAMTIAFDNYKECNCHVSDLPSINAIQDLTDFADNGLGVAAFEHGKMVGFMCSYQPFDNAFDSTNIRGVFCPMGANAGIKENRANIYASMYQAAGDKWIRAKAVSHAICLYAHDQKLQRQFYLYGFGLRCMDAIRPMEVIDCITCNVYDFVELSKNNCSAVYPLELALHQHYNKSPFFMNRKPMTIENFIKNSTNENIRYFIAKYNNQVCAFIEISNTGETFITNEIDYCHITGAYCLPEHRGKGLYQNLLNFTISKLKTEGYTRLGVDFESLNPTAYGFWLKYFTPYTHGVVRRIDENILDLYK